MRITLLLSFLFVYSSITWAQQVEDLLLDARYNEAITRIDSELPKASPEKKIFLETQKAEALIRMGSFADAEKLLADIQSRTISSPFQRASVQTTYGLLYLNQGRNDLSLEILQKALGNFEAAGKSESLEAAQALSHLGNLYRSTGQYMQAEEQLSMALTVRQKQLKENSELIAASYNDLGLVYSMIDNDKALEYYEKAQVIYNKLHGKEHPKVAIAYTNIGFIYSKLELYGDAINNFESALAIWEKVYPQQAHPTKAIALFNLGNIYTKTGNTPAATGYFDLALKMYEDSYGKKHPDVARTLNAIGNLSVAAGNFDVALNQYQRALQANVTDFESEDIHVNPRPRNFYDGHVMLYSMLYKAEAFEARHFNKTLKFSDLESALQTLQTCDTLIDKLRQQITNESDKIMLGAIANEVYADGVRIAFEAEQVAFKKKPYAELAFYFAEKSKSAVLLEAISDANAKSFAGIPNELLEEEKNLKSAIALCAQKLAQKPSGDEEKYLRETSFNLNRSYEAFTKKLENQFPEYFNLKFNASAPSIRQLQTRLDTKTAILSYFIDEKNSRLYVFQITGKQFKITPHTLPKEFDRYITGMRNSIFFNEVKTYRMTAGKLSALLIPKTPKAITNLVILPTGRLSIIPFESLFTTDPAEENSYQQLPYVVKKYSVRYEFSAALILQKEKSKTVAANQGIFLCAPVTFPEKDNLNDLPGSESEVKNISQLFTAKNLNSGVFLGAKADEKLIKSDNLKNYCYLHFATHGVVDESNPELSRIFLQSDADSEDGNLFAGEIYNLELHASLVTLSACQTGLGKISKGEGVIGLSRALVYAGAQSLIVSFWSVADESTASLMTDFYKELLHHETAGFGENLKQAKLNLIASEKYAAPYYWAPFVLIGF
ncbi:MAG TPA: CHAT domain-containing tetratricopeptide repeat protein [Ohtaekwangia sp.]